MTTTPAEATSLGAWIRSYLDRIVNARDVAAVDELVAVDYVGSGHAWAPTRDKLREFYRNQATFRPDWHIDVRDAVEVGEWVAVRAHAGGTVAHDDAGLPMQPQRQAIEWLAAFRVVDGLLIETRFLAVGARDAVPTD
jgi:SnoaL-like polyketide cyclase